MSEMENNIERDATGEAIAENVSEPTEQVIEKEAERIEAEQSVDYSRLVREDILTLREKFSECRASLTDISELNNPVRFAALRDLGLSAEEAYLATGGVRRSYDNRSHLGATVPAVARGAVEIPRAEYEIARGLFTDMSDADIKKLYRKVTK